MADSNVLTEEQQLFLAESEMEFANRYTEADPAYKHAVEVDVPPAPIVMNWVSKPRLPTKHTYYKERGRPTIAAPPRYYARPGRATDPLARGAYIRPGESRNPGNYGRTQPLQQGGYACPGGSNYPGEWQQPAQAGSYLVPGRISQPTPYTSARCSEYLVQPAANVQQNMAGQATHYTPTGGSQPPLLAGAYAGVEEPERTSQPAQYPPPAGPYNAKYKSQHSYRSLGQRYWYPYTSHQRGNRCPPAEWSGTQRGRGRGSHRRGRRPQHFWAHSGPRFPASHIQEPVRPALGPSSQMYIVMRKMETIDDAPNSDLPATQFNQLAHGSITPANSRVFPFN